MLVTVIRNMTAQPLKLTGVENPIRPYDQLTIVKLPEGLKQELEELTRSKAVSVAQIQDLAPLQMAGEENRLPTSVTGVVDGAPPRSSTDGMKNDTDEYRQRQQERSEALQAEGEAERARLKEADANREAKSALGAEGKAAEREQQAKDSTEVVAGTTGSQKAITNPASSTAPVAGGQAQTPQAPSASTGQAPASPQSTDQSSTGAGATKTDAGKA